jgi:hypothetical protein
VLVRQLHSARQDQLALASPWTVGSTAAELTPLDGRTRVVDRLATSHRTVMASPLLSNLASLLHRRVHAERRENRRAPAGHRTACLVRGPVDAPTASALVHNLSAKGAGILVDRQYQPGSRVQLLLINSASTCALTVDMKVVHCGRAAAGRYLIGGPFDRTLRHEELVPFMV